MKRNYYYYNNEIVMLHNSIPMKKDKNELDDTKLFVTENSITS